MKNTRIPTPANAHIGSEAPSKIPADNGIATGTTPTAPELTGDELEDVVGGIWDYGSGTATTVNAASVTRRRP